MTDLVATTESFMFLMIFGALALVAVTGIVMATTSKIASTREHERSRREIAAHVASGALSLDDVERLLVAGADTPGA